MTLSTLCATGWQICVRKMSQETFTYLTLISFFIVFYFMIIVYKLISVPLRVHGCN